MAIELALVSYESIVRPLSRERHTMRAVARDYGVESVSIKRENSSYWDVIPSFANRFRLCTMTVPGAIPSSRAIDFDE